MLIVPRDVSMDSISAILLSGSLICRQCTKREWLKMGTCDNPRNKSEPERAESVVARTHPLSQHKVQSPISNPTCQGIVGGVTSHWIHENDRP